MALIVTAFSKNRVEGDNILGRQLNIFVEQGATDSRFVHGDHFRQVRARQRTQERALAGFQKALLALDQRLGNLLDCPPPLLQVLQEHVGALDIGDHMLLMIEREADAAVARRFAAVTARPDRIVQAAIVGVDLQRIIVEAQHFHGEAHAAALDDDIGPDALGFGRSAGGPTASESRLPGLA